MPGHSSNYTHYGERYKKSKTYRLTPELISVDRDVDLCRKGGQWNTVPKPYKYRVAGKQGVNQDSAVTDGHSASQYGEDVTEEQLFSIVQHKEDARNMRSLQGGNSANSQRQSRRAVSANSCVWHQRPHKVYGSQSVRQEKLEDIVERMTTPTIASRGGIDLAHKNFVYIPPPNCKTFIIIPGLETRFMGKKVEKCQMDAIIERLTRSTHAMKSRFAMDPHSWYDNSGWADRHRAQTASLLR